MELYLLLIAAIIFLFYFGFKVIQFVFVAVNLYREMVKYLAAIASELEYLRTVNPRTLQK